MSNRPETVFANLIANRAEETPDFDVVTFEGGGVRPDETLSYRDLWDNGLRLAQVLKDLGVKPGQRFALLMANHPEFVEAMTAASILGAAVVPIDPRARGEKLRFLLDKVECAGVLAADYALDNLEEVRPSLPRLAWIAAFATDEGARPLADYRGVTDWAAIAPSSPPDLPILGEDPDSALELIFTSGTTGDPKGIVMTQRRYCETSLMANRLFGYGPDEKLYSGLSLTHANAQIITLGAALACKLRCVLSRRFTKSRLWNITRKYGATSFTLLGGMTTAVYAEPPRPDDSDNPVRHIVSAGMPAAIWKAFEQRFNVKILEFYGAAEGGLTFNYPGLGPVGSIGKPPPSLKHRIVDAHGNDVPRGSPGELLFRHANDAPFAVEYFGDAAASARKCADGWLHMGDVAHEDENGWLFFDYRKGAGIRRNGEFVNTAFIEKAIAESGLVDDVYVYGVASANQVPGEKDVVAALVPKDPSAFLAPRVFEICKDKLEANFVPSFLQVLTHIPKTASEKPLERFLIEAFEREPDGVHRRA
ncbi:MAG: AMP-binding protein [Hyphomicrobiales bacterium]|nr:AMP-binding protein [Hyphomicrobiales bacterium]